MVVVITGVVEGPDADMEAGAEGAPGKAEGSGNSESDETALRRFSPRLKWRVEYHRRRYFQGDEQW